MRAIARYRFAARLAAAQPPVKKRCAKAAMRRTAHV
jgi:hypothetical protein